MTKLKDAQEKLNKFLEENPRAIEEQEKINKLMNNTPQTKRAEVLCILIAGNLKQIIKEFDSLNTILTKVR